MTTAPGLTDRIFKSRQVGTAYSPALIRTGLFDPEDNPEDNLREVRFRIGLAEIQLIDALEEAEPGWRRFIDHFELRVSMTCLEMLGRDITQLGRKTGWRAIRLVEMPLEMYRPYDNQMFYAVELRAVFKEDDADVD